MKIINNQHGELIIMDNIVIVTWTEGDTKNIFPYVSDKNGVVYAKDTNNNNIFLGEYERGGAAQDVTNSILKWLVDSEDTLQYDMPIIDDEERLEAIARETLRCE